jgi:hypothetical protein
LTQESPDYWLTLGNPWEIKRNKVKYTISYGGAVTKDGKWTPDESVRLRRPLSRLFRRRTVVGRTRHPCEDVARPAIPSRRVWVWEAAETLRLGGSFLFMDFSFWWVEEGWIQG